MNTVFQDYALFPHMNVRQNVGYSLKVKKLKGAAVEKAIRDSGLGLNPQSEGSVIRVPVPDLSEDRRKEMVKVAGKYCEAGKIAVRNIRRDAIEQVRKDEKDGGMSEDERHALEAQVQKATDAHIAQVDEMLAQKEKDILNV